MTPNWRLFAPLMIALTGCLSTGDTTRLGTSPFWYQTVAPARVSVLSGSVTLQGPQGYCVDPKATISDDDTAFAIFGSCGALADSTLAGQPSKIAMLTVSVSEKTPVSVSKSADALVSHLQSQAGRQTLARNGNSDAVTILTASQQNAAILLEITDLGIPESSGQGQTYWRGLFDLDGRITTASVFALQGRRLTQNAARELLLEFVNSLRIANNIAPSVPTLSTKG